MVVWDFDWSLVNENSDTYVIQQLDGAGKVIAGVKQRMCQPGGQWTQTMEWAVGELHAAGHSPSAISNALVSLPILDGALEAVSAAKASGAEQRILSDANTVYISTILDARGLVEAFGEVVTNSASFDSAGRLHVRPHQPTSLPHDCPLCPANLCKGAVLDEWLRASRPSRCVYVGDGNGDFCPATRLRAGDVVLARQAPHDALLRRCRQEPDAVRATIVEWGGAADGEGAALREGMRAALAGL